MFIETEKGILTKELKSFREAVTQHLQEMNELRTSVAFYLILRRCSQSWLYLSFVWLLLFICPRVKAKGISVYACSVVIRISLDMLIKWLLMKTKAISLIELNKKFILKRRGSDLSKLCCFKIRWILIFWQFFLLFSGQLSPIRLAQSLPLLPCEMDIRDLPNVIWQAFVDFYTKNIQNF